MAGFDLGTLSPQLLDEMLQDHMTSLEPLLAFEQWTKVKDVSTRAGTMKKWGTPIAIPSAGHRTSKVAPGSPTPRGNTSLDGISYKCDEYKWGEDIEEGEEKELQTLDDVSEDLVGASAKKILRDFNADIADMLLGNGTSANDQDLTEKAVSNAWDTASGTPIDDIDEGLLALRGAEIDIFMGYDIAQILSKNSQITGDAAGSGKEYIRFQAMVSELISRGASRVIIDGSVQQDSERNFARSYAGVYDGVFTLGIRNNIRVMRFKQLMQKILIDDDRDVKTYKAIMSACSRREYKEHTYYYTGTKT